MSNTSFSFIDDITESESEIENVDSDIEIIDEVVKRKRTLKDSNIAKVSKKSKPDPIEDMWVNEYTPEKISDVCVHKKKIKDLETEIQNLINKRDGTRILVVSGPSGCGKSTSVKILAKSIMETRLNAIRRMMMSSEIGDKIYAQNNDYIVEFNILKESRLGNSTVRYFGEFLSQCKLLTGINEKCVIVEELPNLFHKETLFYFRKAMLDWLNTDSQYRLPPLIFCISEYDIANDDSNWNGGFTLDNTFKVETVLGYEVMKYLDNGLRRIMFNKVAVSFIKNAIIRITQVRRIKRDTIVNNKITEMSKLGDLRNAINTFEFWYKFQYGKDGFGEGEDIEGKGGVLDIFHSIGKVIYGTKHEEEEWINFQKRHNVKLLNTTQVSKYAISADTISSEIMSDVNGFNLSVLENYQHLNPPICEELNKMMDIMSLSDNMITMGKGKGDIMKNIAFYDCYGLRNVFDKMKGKGSSEKYSRKMNFSRDKKLNSRRNKTIKDIQEFQEIYHSRGIFCSGNIANLIDGYYVSIIMNSFKLRMKIYNKIGDLKVGKIERVGGEFNNTIAVSDKLVDEIADAVEEVPVGGIKDLKFLQDAYFGAVVAGDDEDDGEGYEIDSDPIENSDECSETDHIQNKDDDDDEFSDDSLVLEMFE